MRFGGQFTRFIEEASKRTSAYGLNPTMGLHLYVVGRAMVDEIGIFDPNYWPIYQEDMDYWRRAILAGITGCGTSDFPFFQPDYVSCVGDAIALKSGSVKVDFSENERYMIRKWGMVAPHTEEAYKTPFNIPGCPLSYFPEPIDRSK